MEWRPIQPKQAGPSPFFRAIISRATMLLLAAALLFASYKCLHVVKRAWAETDEFNPPSPASVSGVRARKLTGTGLPLAVGIGLGGLGLIVGAAAVLPTSLFERFHHPPGDPHEHAATLRRFFRWP
jgi:hypothetical protein